MFGKKYVGIQLNSLARTNSKLPFKTPHILYALKKPPALLSTQVNNGRANNTHRQTLFVLL